VSQSPYLPKEATLPDKVIEIHRLKADNPEKYLPLLKRQKIGIVTNQSGIVLLEQSPINIESKKQIHLVDFLLDQKNQYQKIFAEHGFEALQMLENMLSTERIIKLINYFVYGNNKTKFRTVSRNRHYDFDLQDVGARLHLHLTALHNGSLCRKQHPFNHFRQTQPNILLTGQF
jgi:uncharacterized protein YbbC (DUF1343 family)